MISQLLNRFRSRPEDPPEPQRLTGPEAVVRRAEVESEICEKRPPLADRAARTRARIAAIEADLQDANAEHRQARYDLVEFDRRTSAALENCRCIIETNADPRIDDAIAKQEFAKSQLRYNFSDVWDVWSGNMIDCPLGDTRRGEHYMRANVCTNRAEIDGKVQAHDAAIAELRALKALALDGDALDERIAEIVAS